MTRLVMGCGRHWGWALTMLAVAACQREPNLSQEQDERARLIGSWRGSANELLITPNHLVYTDLITTHGISGPWRLEANHVVVSPPGEPVRRLYYRWDGDELRVSRGAFVASIASKNRFSVLLTSASQERISWDGKRCLYEISQGQQRLKTQTKCGIETFSDGVTYFSFRSARELGLGSRGLLVSAWSNNRMVLRDNQVFSPTLLRPESALRKQPRPRSD